MNRVAVALLLSGALTLPSAVWSQGYAPMSAGVEEAVVSLELARLEQRVTTVERDGEIAWIPLVDFAALTGFGYHDGVEQASLTRGGEAIATFGRGAARRTSTQSWVVRSDSLGQSLGTEIQIDWQELRIVMLNAAGTPVGERIVRERRQEALLREAATSPLTARAARPFLDGLSVEYGVGFTSGGTPDRISTTIGTSVMGGGMKVQIDQGEATRVDASWTTAWTDNRPISQLRLGDGMASGPHPRMLRGISISNAPLARFEDMGDLPVTGQVGAGWEVEAYRGGRLIAVRKADAFGHYRFDVPVRIGENPVSVIAYGPGGERHESSKSLTINDQVTKPGRFEYALSAGECRSTECTFSGNLDARWGVAPGWTVRGGYEEFSRHSAPVLHHPYAGVTGRVLNQLWVEGEAVLHASGKVGLRYEPSAAFSLRSEYFRFDDDVVRPILTVPDRRAQFTSALTWRPAGMYGSTSLELATDHVLTATGSQSSARVAVSLSSGRLRLLPSARLLRTDQRGAPRTTRSVGVTAMLFPGAGGGGIPLLGDALLRATMEGDPVREGLQMAGVYASWPASRVGQFEIGAGWNRMGGTSLTVRSTISLGGARLFGSVTRHADGRVEAQPYLQGMFYLNPTRGIESSAEVGGERAGVMGRVWVDSDGDGIHDPEESPAAGVRISIGARSVITDDRGEYEAFGFAPYLPLRMSIDSMSFPSPLLVAALPDTGIAVAPFRLARIDLPLTPGGVLDGRIEGPDGAPAANAELTLCRLGTHDCRRVRSFSDGGVYQLGMRPGNWVIQSDSVVVDSVRIRGGQSTSWRYRLAAATATREVAATWERALLPPPDTSDAVPPPPPEATPVIAPRNTGASIAATPIALSHPTTAHAAREEPRQETMAEAIPHPDMIVSEVESESQDTPIRVGGWTVLPPIGSRVTASVTRARDWMERRDPFDRPRRAIPSTD